MTNFGEQLTIDNVCIKAFYRLPISYCNENCVLLNDGTKSVVKLPDEKQSWTLAYPHSFTCPAIVDRRDESVYSVIDSRVLLKWSLFDDVLKLKTAIKAKFQETVFAVLPADEQSPILLFTSGRVLRCGTLDSDHRTPIGEAVIGGEEEIVWADTIVCKSVIRVICLVFSKQRSTHSLCYFTVVGGSVSEYRTQHLQNGTDKLIHFCLNKETHYLYTLWSSGTVLGHHLDGQAQSTLLTTPEAAEKEQLHAIDSLDSNHIVLLKSNPGLKETYLEMWDIKFATMKDKKLLKLWSASSYQMRVLGSLVYLSLDEGLASVSFHVQESTLAAAVGKSIATPPEMQEFRWSKGKLTQLSDSKTVEKMDTSEIKVIPLDKAELNAQRIMEEGSDFLNYIPECELVKLLCLALRYKFEESGKFKGSFEPDTILNSIFSTSFTDAFLIQFMKKLSLEESMTALEVLLTFLNHKVCNKNNPNEVIPTDFQLLNWIFLVYQAHMEAFLLSKDKRCVRLIQKLDSCILEKTHEFEEYNSIQNMFLVLQKKTNILPENYVMGKYCIESLDI